MAYDHPLEVQTTGMVGWGFVGLGEWGWVKVKDYILQPVLEDLYALANFLFSSCRKMHKMFIRI